MGGDATRLEDRVSASEISLEPVSPRLEDVETMSELDATRSVAEISTERATHCKKRTLRKQKSRSDDISRSRNLPMLSDAFPHSPCDSLSNPCRMSSATRELRPTQRCRVSHLLRKYKGYSDQNGRRLHSGVEFRTSSENTKDIPIKMGGDYTAVSSFAPPQKIQRIFRSKWEATTQRCRVSHLLRKYRSNR
jgi:hypothetical protein